MIFHDEINEIGEELNIDEIKSNLVDNIAPKPEEFSEPSRINTHFMRLRYLLVGHTTNVLPWVYPKEDHDI